MHATSSPLPLRIFISGNSKEFKEFRRVATEAVLSRGWVPVAQDHFATEHGSLPDLLKKLVVSCDATICLVGKCYGFEPHTRAAGAARRSYTQMEYDFGRAAGMPVFIMLAEGVGEGGGNMEGAELAALQKSFVQAIKDDNQLWHSFSTGDELKLRILGIPSNLLAEPSTKPREPFPSRGLWAGLAFAAALVVGVVWKRADSPDEGQKPVVKQDTAPAPVQPPAVVATSRKVVNSLGMEFLPLEIVGGQEVLISKWETRIRDWKSFTHAAGIPEHHTPDGALDLQPVTDITLSSMVAFCSWLTSHETAAGNLPAGAFYRLPTEEEWRRAAGVQAGEDKSIFAWDGLSVPESRAMANFAGRESAIGNPQLPDDHYVKTAPVGSFPSNKAGLFDIAGNIGEVCSVPGGKPVICGGDWQDQDFARMNLAASRPYEGTDDISETVGFRCVLEMPR